jgi:cytochrome c553/cytochrome c5
MTPLMRRRSLLAGALALSAGLAGFLVAASGIVPIKASSGHFAITEWLLQFGKRRSVATHTIGLELPDLNDPALILRGAGHYHTGCRPCHGSPALHEPRVARAMLPPPPYLPPRIAQWEPDELFYMVKHGIKFTGMPAWPTQQRDDEVQSMVAFLREFPGLDVQGYDRLVFGDTSRPDASAPLTGLDRSTDALVLGADCARCHGVDGNGREAPAFPKLAGQSRKYLMGALRAYATDRRHSGIMQPVAAGLRDAQVTALAEHFARQTPRRAPPHADAAARERGARIANTGIAAQRVPACTDCHGPEGARRRDEYPLLTAQHAEYLLLQLKLFQADHRGGSEYAHLMRTVAKRLRHDQMRDVALYYASLPPPR